MKSRRGFTDHEHLDEVELIHMNGRVYDYHLGRFLSVDPIIHGGSQGLNPYSYIMNNPLAGTDPTGYTPEPDVETKEMMVSTTGSKIKHKVTVTATQSSDGTVTVAFSGNNGAAVAAAKSVASESLSGSGFNVTDIGSQSNLAKSKPIADSAVAKEPDESTISNKTTTRSDFWDNPDKASIDGDDITINANVFSDSSQLTDAELDKQLESFSQSFSGEVEGRGKLSINFIRVADKKDADMFITDCDYFCGAKYKQSTGKSIDSFAGFVNGAGRGNTVFLHRRYYGRNSGTLHHEMGHFLGLHHQRNNTKSIMSYNFDDRSITKSDRRRLYDGYHLILKKY